MDRILDIRNLRISFKTNNGTVKAVRGINFELNRGETLAIVGESGSGKSVTARAMLGILAGNSIVDSGEIIYDGKDLLKISEDEFHDYRGNKISMIFQDPMSSLNPIMRIGKQLTEAMLLNGKANQKSAKKEFNEKIKLLEEWMIKANEKSSNPLDSKKISEMIATFKKFVYTGNDIEEKFNDAYENAKTALTELDVVLLEIKQDDPKNTCDKIDSIITNAKESYHEFVVRKESSHLPAALENLASVAKTYTDKGKCQPVINALTKVFDLLDNVVTSLEKEKPNFFTMGYYVTFNSKESVLNDDISTLNLKMRKFLDENFMLEFLKLVEAGIKCSFDESLDKKKDLIAKLDNALPTFEAKNLEKNKLKEVAKELIKAVEGSIDRLAIKKDNSAYTFGTSLMSDIETYFNGIPRNEKETKRVERETKKYEKAIAKGKNVGKVVPPVIVDLDLIHSNMYRVIRHLKKSYIEQIDNSKKVDFSALAVEFVDHLKEQASRMVYKVTKEMAYTNAIKLMKEVGIPQPQKRFRQFPFQFSGGMRQRIVIAIALAANPDILICDEPTTALDVTIQAQILELINNLKNERKLSVIFITHDLGVVANMADKIAVMYAGKIVEYGNVNEIFYEPAHPYTWALLSSMPDLDTKEKLEAIPGTPPNMIHPPVGDAFAARNKYALQIDFEQEPPLFEITPTHSAATWLLHPDAPKVNPPKVVVDRINRMKNVEVSNNG